MSDKQDYHRGYVKTSDGRYLVQLPHADARWGFYLLDDDQSWDGGFGIAEQWESVETVLVPRKVRKSLDWILEDDGRHDDDHDYAEGETK